MPPEQLAEVGGARGGDHQQPGAERVVEQVREQLRRARVRPVQVVDDQHHGALRRGAGREVAHDALEQPPAVLLVTRIQLVAEVPEGADERLVRDQRLGVRAAEQHGRALAVHAARELGREPGLADPGLAHEQHELALTGLRGGVAGVDLRERVGAAHERAADALQRGRERDRGRLGPGRRAGGDAALGRFRVAVVGGGEDRPAEVTRRRVARARLLGHRAPDHGAESLAGVGEHGQHGGRRRVQVREHRRRGGLPRVRDLARERLVEHAAERVHVGACVDRAFAQLLGRGVVERADRPFPPA